MKRVRIHWAVRSFVTRGRASVAVLLFLIPPVATPVHAQSPPPAIRIGLLVPASSHGPPLPSVRSLFQRLEELGYAEGRNLATPQSILIRADEVIQ